MSPAVELEIECPLDGSTEDVEIEELEDGSVEVECSVCGATLEATYTVAVDVDVGGVDVVDPPSAAGDCPQCGNEATIEEIEDESGEAEIECEGCESQLVVRWSEWGSNVEVELVEAAVVEEDGHGEEDEDEDENGEEDYGEEDEIDHDEDDEIDEDEDEDQEVEDW